MDSQIILGIICVLYFIFFQQCSFFKKIEVKVLNGIIGILICIFLSVLLVNVWMYDKTEVYVNMPSIGLMRSYIDEFGDSYQETRVPEEKRREFWLKAYMGNAFFENYQSEGENNNQDKEPLDDNTNIESELGNEERNQIGVIISDMFNEKIIALLQVIVLILVIFILYHVSLFPRYCNNVEKQIDGYEHILMGENNLEDILISVNIIKENVSKKNNLCSYMRKEILNNKKGIYFLLGQAGEGKSVALMQLALMIIKERKWKILKKKDKRFERIPLLVPVAEIEEFEEKKFEEQLYKHMLEIYLGSKLKFLTDTLFSKSKKVFSKYLKYGKFIILLDGYDEVNEDKRYAFVCMMERLIANYPTCIFVISSRTYVFKEDNYPIFHTGTILKLDTLNKEQIYEFIRKWNFRQEKSAELYHKILANSQLGYLTSNALILTLVCFMFDNDVQVAYNSIVEFYAAASVCLLKTWEDDKKIQKRIKLSLETKQEALESYAYYQLINDRTWSSKKELMESIKGCAENNGILPVDIVNEISLQTGILEKSQKGNYRFYHRSFYEFFAAKYMVDNNIALDILETDVEMHCNIISFYLALKNDTELTSNLLQRHQEKKKFVSRVLAFCEVEDKSFIEGHIYDDLDNIEKYNTDAFKEIGELAHKYECIRGAVKEKIFNIFKREKVILIKQNCFITLAYFENHKSMARFMVDNFSSKEIIDIILMSDDMIDRVIYHLVDENLGLQYMREIFDGLVRTYKYDLLFRMMLGSEDSKVKELVMRSFLHCTKENIFLEWLEDKEFLKYEREVVANRIIYYAKKYKWCNNNFSTNIIMNLYVIVWYAIQLLDEEENKFDLERIDNRVKFLITYLKNVQNPTEIKNYLVDINDFEVESLVEFEYHWRRADKNKINMLGKDPIMMGKLAITVIVFLNLALMFYYLLRTVDIPYLLNFRFALQSKMNDLFFEDGNNFMGYDVINVAISRYFKFNSFYFIMGIILHIIQKFLHNWISQCDFKIYYVIYHLLIALLTINLYCMMIQEINFRRVYGISIFFIMLIGIVQHKNNYPSFRNPQFTRIRRYLK